MLEFREQIEKEVPRDDAADFGEQMILYSLIRAIKPNIVVEVGTHKGMTSLYMAHALYDNGIGVLHTCDPFEWGQQGNFRKFPELEKLIKFYPIKGEELDVDEIDILFLDGYHEYEYVERELKHFIPRLSEKGIIIFHDCKGDKPGGEVGVNTAIRDAGLSTVLIPTENYIRIYCKDDDINLYSNNKT